MTHSEASSKLRSRVARRRVTHSSTAATVHVAPRCIAKPIKPAQIAETANASVEAYTIAVTLEEKREGARRLRAPFRIRPSHSTQRASVAVHMCCIIVSGFLSLTMSAIVSTTVVLPSFFHQCCVPRNSREMSPARCRIGTVHLLLFS